MAIKPINFIGYSPDLDVTEPGVFEATDKLIPTSRGFFRPQPSLVVYGNALPLQVLGAIEAQYLNGTIRVFGGTSAHLYEETGGAGGTWSAVDGGTLFAAPTAIPGAGWRFAVFGNACIAQDGVDSPVAAPSTGNFAGITPPPGNDAMPTAKAIASVANNFVMLGNITVSTDAGFPASADRWWACAQGDYTNWSPSTTTLSATGRLLDTPGGITGLKSIGTNITFAAYKQQATYLGIFVGVPVIWQFIRVSSLIGAFSQESVVDIGNVHVFPSYDDFYTFEGTNIQRLETPIRDWFYQNVNLNALITGTSNILGAFDRIRDIVYWYFPTTSNTLDTWVAWNIRSNVWTTGTLTVEAAITPEVPISTPSVGVFKSDHKLYTISGAANPNATFTTGDIGDHQLKYFVRRLRPKFEVFPATASSVNVNGYTRENLGDITQNPNANVPMHPAGWVNLRQAGRWHSFQFNLTSDCEIIGMDVEAEETGLY